MSEVSLAFRNSLCESHEMKISLLRNRSRTTFGSPDQAMMPDLDDDDDGVVGVTSRDVGAGPSNAL